jgi:uncharacterized repeat protein (TIGR01451 family)
VPSGINYALETQDRPFFPSVGSVNGNTLIPELAHQWFGDNVAPKVWNDIWINEGMATWGPTWHNSVLSPTTPNPGAVETSYFNSWNNTASASSNWSVAPSGMTDTRDLYGYQTYTRGAQLYEALRTAIGDTAYFAFLKQWQSRYDDGNGGARDFEALAEEISGRDLTAFFQDWIWETGKPVWPGKFNLALTADKPAGPLVQGEALTYTLTVTNTGKVTLGDATATLDLSDVLDDATLGALPSGVTRSGDVLTWTMPSTPVTVGSNTATVSVPVTLNADASGDTIDASAASTTLGSNCTPATCTTEHSVDVYPLAPVSTPTITGTPMVTEQLTAHTGAWPAGTSFAYQWWSGADPVPGATGATYVVQPDDVGRHVSVRVTGSKPQYSSVARTSAGTDLVSAATFGQNAVVVLDGQAKVGKKLTAQIGSFSPDATMNYRWFVGSEVVKSGPGDTLKIKRSMKGKRIKVVVDVSQPGYVMLTMESKKTPKVG